MTYYGVIYEGKEIIFKDVKKFQNFIYKDKNKKILKDKISFRKFQTERNAKKWFRNNNGKVFNEIKHVKEDTIYFDAGVGRGIGTETRVTNFKGESIIHEANLTNLKINEYGNVCFGNVTNNYGELAGLYIALKIALNKNIKKIAGDSQLAIKWWSNGFYNEKNLNESTVKLIKATQTLRKKFEDNGGYIFYINGDYNPADLGFHKPKKK